MEAPSSHVFFAGLALAALSLQGCGTADNAKHNKPAPPSWPVWTGRSRVIAPGVVMPTMNLGTCCGSDPTLGVPAWLRAGGVGIDTAYDYNDQPKIAAALKTAFSLHNLTRSDVFITTKVPAGVGAAMHYAYNRTGPEIDCTLDYNRSLAIVRENLKELELDYVDLVLLHGPCELQGAEAKIDPAKANAAQWRGLEVALKEGLTRAIGVSNYNISHLEALAKDNSSKVTPAVNQCQMSVNGPAMCFANGVCLHGPAHDDATLKYCLDHNITYEAYDSMRGCPWTDERVKSIAAKHGMSVAQVCMRWTLQRGAIVAAGTGHNVSKVFLDSKDNLGVYTSKFHLSDEDMEYISNIHSSPKDHEILAYSTLVV